MNGELAQAATLVSYGNRWLRTDLAMPPFDGQEPSAFRYAHSIRFIRHPRRLFLIRTSAVVARDPGEWLLWVTRNGGGVLKLVISTDFKWLIRVSDLAPAVWRPRLKRRLVRGGGRPWNQIYEGVDDWLIPERPGKDVVAAGEELKRALDSLVEFAQQAELHEFAGRFNAARSILNRHDAPIPYYPDLLPPDGREAHRLAAACTTASMFAGADSWADLPSGIRGRADYKAVTAAAYAAVLDGIAAASNA